MVEASLGSMSLSHREEYTSVALKRSANIQYCAPEGYFKLIHAITLAAYNGDPKTMGEIRDKYDRSSGGSKDIILNLGKLTAQPFPIVVSKKKVSKNSDSTISTPLYDVATGNTVSQDYASAALSPLGRLLTRHYKDEPMDFSDHYKSIVPLSLLRKSMPWTMGHKSEMYPLNPNELFRIMIKMIEKGSPIIDDKDLEGIFKGFDLGDDYNIYMTSAALISLYVKGESSFMVMPNIEIRKDANKVVIKVPPLDATSVKLVNYLAEKSLDQSDKAFKTIRFDPEVKMVGKEVHMDITTWNGTEEEILNELYHDRFITRKAYTRNESIRYKDDYEARPDLIEDGTLGKTKIPISLFDVEELKRDFTEDELLKFGAKEILDNLDALDLIENSNNRESEKEHFKLMIKGNQSTKELFAESNFQISKNPYPFELDIVPIFEVLWDCIQYEKECKIKAIKKELKALQEQLKLDLLLEKITRPDVAKFIHSLEPDSDRSNKLLRACEKDSELLPEGLERWEVDLVYGYSNNNFLPKIFFRKKFEHLYITTMNTIKALEETLNNPKAIEKEIKEDLEVFTGNSNYDRKSKVHFLKDDVNMKMEYISANDNWDKHDLPCTLFFDSKYLRRNYGVNKYFNDFQPVMELNTTNDSKFSVIYRDGKGKLSWKIYQAKDIPRGRSVTLPPDLIGLLPIEQDRKQQIMFWTNHSRYYIYNGIMVNDIEFEPTEIILGWCYIDGNKPYLDIRSSEGIQRVMATEFPQFKTKLKSFTAYMGLVYDILPRSENDNVIKLWRNEYKDYQKFESVLLKSKNAKPRELEKNLYSKVFSPNMNRYYESIYIWNWHDVGFAQEHKYPGPKKVTLNEYAYIEYGERVSDRILDSVRNTIRSKYFRKNVMDHTDEVIIARYSKAYLDFNPFEHKDTNAIDYRILTK